MTQEYLTKEQQVQKKIKLIATITAVLIVVALAGFGVVKLAQKSPTAGGPSPTLDQINDTDHVLGNRDAKIVLIEYSDFQCPACRAYSAQVEKLHQDFPTDLVIVYRHYPLSQHKNAIPAAQASEAGGVQGKFWAMAKLIFDDQPTWSGMSTPIPKFVEYAGQLGLNLPAFESDLYSASLASKINNDKTSGDQVSLTGTPSFYLNGQKIGNPSTYQQFYDLVKNAVK
ncbi:MAG: hypothetical protein A3B10_03860 [Candidatus Doudnabacteria bacterium RIFCSPLOWO2_01_FULL_44_21]|uniref:Thioredoxin domain-containing protein n=1 Tax=Candidatus Doudnabacteria bacterium RIFCSPLOWO2_01_FULL_44_21 TaxID=1817841 RepID=A0A1F5PYA9_9BACT|nr:MAG: hypothetical protein A3B95_01985 [Candidatus Doudnabacteria bacterium RIFCSPHIGHO2_02_FULL_43_13b]OGE94893.1 MAG: hypothetical protein A3B10_03860 [Candidatus Doudnabacteria bacterium RIFCSPLOWO2_01_FULL_44_21]